MPTSRTIDLQFIDETLRLARKARGQTHPNPMVGAVIVRAGRVLGRGYHHRAGMPHAEIEAFRSATTDVIGATLYVNLEPCSHHGRTPPCADAIIRAGIKRVVCCTLDPNPQVNGRGLARLAAAGIEVVVGLRAREARTLNRAFFQGHEGVGATESTPGPRPPLSGAKRRGRSETGRKRGINAT